MSLSNPSMNQQDQGRVERRESRGSRDDQDDLLRNRYSDMLKIGEGTYGVVSQLDISPI